MVPGITWASFLLSLINGGSASDLARGLEVAERRHFLAQLLISLHGVAHVSPEIRSLFHNYIRVRSSRAALRSLKSDDGLVVWCDVLHILEKNDLRGCRAS